MATPLKHSVLFILALLAADCWAADELQALRAKAEQGNVTAQLELGVRYETAWGVPQDSAAAAQWYRQAAEQGEAHAQEILGMMYSTGEGVPQDYLEAYKWVTRAASTLTGPAHDQAEKNRQEIVAKMTAAQIAAAQETTRAWQPSPPQSK